MSGDLLVCVVSLRILNGERVRGSGGGEDCDGAVSRAVERQRMQVLCCCDCRSSRFQQLDCRSVGALEAMMGNLYGLLNSERCRRRQLAESLEKRAKKVPPV